jgi:hypothetical protein
MSQTILSQILEELQFLEPVELQQLSHAVQNRLINKEKEAKQVAFHQALIDLKTTAHTPQLAAIGLFIASCRQPT